MPARCTNSTTLRRARQVLREVVEKSRNLKPRDNHLHCWVTYELGSLLHSTGKQKEAQPLLEEAAALLEKYRMEDNIVYDRVLQQILDLQCQIRLNRVERSRSIAKSTRRANRENIEGLASWRFARCARGVARFPIRL